MTIAHRNLVGQHGTHSAVGVDDRHLNGEFLTFFECWFCQSDNLVIQRAFQAMFLRLGMATGDAASDFRLMEYLAEIQATRFPVFDTSTHIQQISTADEVVKLADTDLRH